MVQSSNAQDDHDLGIGSWSCFPHILQMQQGVLFPKEKLFLSQSSLHFLLQVIIQWEITHFLPSSTPLMISLSHFWILVLLRFKIDMKNLVALLIVVLPKVLNNSSPFLIWSSYHKVSESFLSWRMSFFFYLPSPCINCCVYAGH